MKTILTRDSSLNWRLPAIALMLLLGLSSVWAQKAELTPFIGYQFGGNFTVWSGELDIVDDMHYGAMLDISMPGNVQVELLYSRQATVMRLHRYPIGGTTTLFDMSIQYFHLGGLRLFAPPSAKIRPFVVGTLGMSLINPFEPGVSSAWLASLGFGFGAKAFVNQRLGLRFQAGLMLPFKLSGGAIFIGGGGADIGVTGYCPFVQGNVSAGLILAL